MKKYILIIFALSLCVNVIAGPLTKSGKCKLTGNAPVKVTLKNSKVKVISEFYVKKFVDDLYLHVDEIMTDLTSKEMDLSVNVVFMDKDNKLVASLSHCYNIYCKGKDFDIGSRIIIPKDIVDKIVAYKLIIYPMKPASLKLKVKRRH